jgi:hypothetical protein
VFDVRGDAFEEVKAALAAAGPATESGLSIPDDISSEVVLGPTRGSGQA